MGAGLRAAQLAREADKPPSVGPGLKPFARSKPAMAIAAFADRASRFRGMRSKRRAAVPVAREGGLAAYGQKSLDGSLAAETVSREPRSCS